MDRSMESPAATPAAEQENELRHLDTDGLLGKLNELERAGDGAALPYDKETILAELRRRTIAAGSTASVDTLLADVYTTAGGLPETSERSGVNVAEERNEALVQELRSLHARVVGVAERVHAQLQPLPAECQQQILNDREPDLQAISACVREGTKPDAELTRKIKRAGRAGMLADLQHWEELRRGLQTFSDRAAAHVRLYHDATGKHVAEPPVPEMKKPAKKRVLFTTLGGTVAETSGEQALPGCPFRVGDVLEPKPDANVYEIVKAATTLKVIGFHKGNVVVQIDGELCGSDTPEIIEKMFRKVS